MTLHRCALYHIVSHFFKYTKTIFSHFHELKPRKISHFSSLNRRRHYTAHYPSELETLKTAIRMAMATKPTAPAIATIRIGSRALVKLVMLRSMSF